MIKIIDFRKLFYIIFIMIHKKIDYKKKYINYKKKYYQLLEKEKLNSCSISIVIDFYDILTFLIIFFIFFI